MATAVTSEDMAHPLTAVERAKLLCRANNVSQSLVCTPDVARAYIDHFLGSDAEQAAATAYLDANRLPTP